LYFNKKILLFSSFALLFIIPGKNAIAVENFLIEVKINLKEIPDPEKLKVVASANGETQVKYIEDIPDAKSGTITIPFTFDSTNNIVSVGNRDEYFVCAYNLEEDTGSMKSYECTEGDIKDSKGQNIADLDLFKTVQPISNNQTENVMINILVPLSDRKNIQNIRVIAMDKGELKSKEVNAAQLLSESSGDTVKFAFNFDRKTDIGHIQEGDMYFACVSANELNPPEGTECEHKLTKPIGQVNNLYAR
jgi:hypothetical protein